MCRWMSSITVMVALVNMAARAQPVSENYRAERIVAASSFHGVHGLAFDRNDVLHAGSVSGQSLYQVDTRTGRVDVVVGPPEGMADDIVFLADGTMVWTSISQGTVRARRGQEAPRVLADKLASVNSINVRKSDGRLFVAQVFGGNDAVWELDASGVKPPRQIIAGVGGLNGFDIGVDGCLYGPLWFKGQVARIDPDRGTLQVVADGFGTPAAANFDSKGNLFVLDTARGELVRVDIATGGKQMVARLETSVDNLAIDSRDRIFVSNMADNGIQEVDPRSGAVRQVVKGELAFPVAMAGVADARGDALYVADIYGFRRVDGATGAVTDLIRAHAHDAPGGYTSAVAANLRHTYALAGAGKVHQFAAGSDKLLRTLEFGNSVQGLLELDDGRVLISDRASGTVAIASVDAPMMRDTVITDLNRPTVIIKAGPQRVYVLESGAGRILDVSLATRTSRVVTATLDRPFGLALSATGKLLTIEFPHQRLLSIDPATGQQEVLATHLPVGANVPSAGTGVVAGHDGLIYFSSDIENSIWRLTPKTRK